MTSHDDDPNGSGADDQFDVPELDVPDIDVPELEIPEPAVPGEPAPSGLDLSVPDAVHVEIPEPDLGVPELEPEPEPDPSQQQQEEDQAGRQRRQNVRVDVQLPLTLRMGGREVPGRTRDVSATGIGFSTRLPVELDQRGEVTVEFNGWRFQKSFVIRFVKPILAGSQVGVQFEELTQEEREKLVKQVFDVQREQLQRKR